uniref:Uncharacterized protein n=1 Tax=Cacopsylla melanoneura TaxID=428564 RepID=A0A8D8W1T2_9HEMI
MELRWEMCQDYDRFYPMVTLCFLHSERKTTARRYTLRCTCVWHATRSDPFIPVMSMSEQLLIKYSKQTFSPSTSSGVTRAYSSATSLPLSPNLFKLTLGSVMRAKYRMTANI